MCAQQRWGGVHTSPMKCEVPEGSIPTAPLLPRRFVNDCPLNLVARLRRKDPGSSFPTRSLVDIHRGRHNAAYASTGGIWVQNTCRCPNRDAPDPTLPGAVYIIQARHRMASNRPWANQTYGLEE